MLSHNVTKKYNLPNKESFVKNMFLTIKYSNKIIFSFIQYFDFFKNFKKI